MAKKTIHHVECGFAFGREREKRPFLGNQSSHGKPHCETCHEMVSEKLMFFLH
jgi:hypothetical protein